ncbi:MAG: PD-(D/E)XK nuclease family protein [Candidatus Zixiibacteriota bacterium]
MSGYSRRTRNLFDPESSGPYTLSRSRLENFIRCQRCFYLDRRLGVDHPPTPGFTLNSAVDTLLKKEFDLYRAQGQPHPLMIEFGVDAIPYAHESIDDWRNVRRGVRYVFPNTNFEVFGAVDDVWINPAGELYVVDYKATSKQGEVTIDTVYGKSYKRQVEIYQWLFEANGFSVAESAYFVYANGIKNRESFDKRLDFKITIIEHQGDTSWINGCVNEAYRCLCRDNPPPPSDWCDYCAYLELAKETRGLSG